MEQVQRPDVITDQAKYKKGWVGGLPETPCGAGSTMRRTEKQREWLPEMVARYGIDDLGDIGAGDLNWVLSVKWPDGLLYKPYDLVPRHDLVTELDIISEVPPKHQALMCLYLLNHLPELNARAAFKNMLDSGCEYMFYTWDSRLWGFLDIEPIEEIQIAPSKPDKPEVKGHDGVFLRLVKC